MEFPEDYSGDGSPSINLLRQEWLAVKNGEFIAHHPDYIKSESLKQRTIKGEVNVNRKRCTEYRAVIKFHSDCYCSACEKLLRLCSDSELTNYSDSEVDMTSGPVKRRRINNLDPDFIYESVEKETVLRDTTKIRSQVPKSQRFAEGEKCEQNRQNESNLDLSRMCANDIDDDLMHEYLEQETVLQERPTINSRAPTIQSFIREKALHPHRHQPHNSKVSSIPHARRSNGSMKSPISSNEKTSANDTMSVMAVDKILKAIKTSFQDVREMFNDVTTRLDDMDTRISNIEAILMSGNKPLMRTDILMEEQPPWLPAQLWDNLVEIECNMKEKKEERSALMTYFVKVGNKEEDLPSAVRSILRHLMAVELQRKVSWMGSSSRNSLQTKPTLVQLLQMSFVHHHSVPEDEKGSAARLKEAVSTAKKWFYGAADRGGGRGQRREKRNAL